MKAGDPIFEACIEETASKTGVRSSKVREVIYRAYPAFHPKFDALPDEILLKILLEMDPYDVSLLCAVSKRFQRICDDDFWKILWEKHVPVDPQSAFEPAPATYRQEFFAFMKEGWDEDRTVTIPGLGRLKYTSSLDRGSVFYFNPKTRELWVPRGVQTLECFEMNIKGLHLPEGLRELACSCNPLETLDIPESLTYLEAYACGLSSFDLKNLHDAMLSENDLRSIQIRATKKIKRKSLHLANNQLTHLDLRKTHWEEVLLPFNNLSSLLLPYNGGILDLNVTGNQLEVLVVPPTVRNIWWGGNPWEKIYLAKTATREMKKGFKKYIDAKKIHYYSLAKEYKDLQRLKNGSQKTETYS